AVEVVRYALPQAPPFDARKITERMLRGRLGAVRQMQVVKPFAERRGLGPGLLPAAAAPVVNHALPCRTRFPAPCAPPCADRVAGAVSRPSSHTTARTVPYAA